MRVTVQIYDGDLPHPIEALEEYFRKGGATLIQAAFAHSYFADPEAVRAKTPYFPDRARYSRDHYSGLEKGQLAYWSGDGRQVKLDDNRHAQMAWERYTRRKLARGTGYSVRHVWGHPWNPDAFTAGWNLCYMPFWAGMLTEQQHPHPQFERAIRQASWDLYFREDPVCDIPDFVKNPGLDLNAILADQPILILTKPTSVLVKQGEVLDEEMPHTILDSAERIKDIRRKAHQSWSNIHKATRALQELPYEPFGTRNVERSAKSCVRKISSETGLSFAQIEMLLDDNGW